MTNFLRGATLLFAILIANIAYSFDLPQPNTGTVKPAEFAKEWGVNPDAVTNKFTISKGLKVTMIESSIPANVLWPGDKVSFTFQFVNQTDQPIKTVGKASVIQFALYTYPGDDVFKTGVRKLLDCGNVPIAIDIPAKGYQDIVVSPAIPEKFGGYAVMIDLDGFDHLFGAGCVRTFKADDSAKQYYKLTMDNGNIDLLKRLGTTVNRIGFAYKPSTDADFETWFANSCKQLDQLKAAGKPVCVEFGASGLASVQPMGRFRLWLDANGIMKDGKADMTWLPQYDADFKKLVKRVAVTYGWPNGPVTAMKFMNEPWNGISISGWGADDLRYREIYTALCEGVEEARAEAKVQVMLGGCDSSSNTFDKLFPDGKDTFLNRLDFMSIHYQGMQPATIVKKFVNRTGPYGRVQVWDTESWVANSDDRVASTLSTMFASGHDRVVGIIGSVISSDTQRGTEDVKTSKGVERRIVTHAWPVAASIGAFQHFIGERSFHEIMFKNGLPWVYIFDGKKDKDDGTVVIVGDLSPTFGRDNILFRDVRGLAEIADKDALRAKLNSLPADNADRAAIEAEIKKPEQLTGATMTIKTSGSSYALYDFYGNPVPTVHGKIVVPLNDLGYYLRSNGKRGSFDKLLKAVKDGRVVGYEPLTVVVHDPTAPIDKGGIVNIEVTNILNRAISGTFKVTLEGLTVVVPDTLKFKPFEKKIIPALISGKGNDANSYKLNLTFNAGKDGKAVHEEDIHCNFIAKRTIVVDGNLDDWNGVLPQPVISDGVQRPTLMETAWLPFKQYDTSYKKGLATGFMAYDKDNFYFAAKIADSTPEDGMLRFENRNDDEYFYPDTSYLMDGAKALMKDEISWSDMAGIANAAAPQHPTQDGVRVQRAWRTALTASAFGIDLKLPIDKTTQLAVYCVDFDDMERRSQKIIVQNLDTKAVLVQKDIDKFQKGKYVVLNLRGNVRVIVRTNMWWFPVMQAFFLDPAATELHGTGNAAAIVQVDDKTGGNWKGVYGKDGYNVVSVDPKYPDYAKVTVIDEPFTMPMKWPDGVRHYSYRKGPELPFGSSPNHDNVQIAFNVMSDEEKPWYSCPPGTMPKFTGYWDSDYEYALDPVAVQYGGGTEIWRVRTPQMPNKHFYPRQLPSPFDGPVKNGNLVITRDGNTRITECAIPWSEIPGVKKRLDAGQTIKFTFRVNDNTGVGCMELTKNRSVARRNLSFKPDWIEHWANEVEFGFEK
ncbi:MAG: hypothetical protein WCO98_06745 [bacterium]